MGILQNFENHHPQYPPLPPHSLQKKQIITMNHSLSVSFIAGQA